MIPDAPALPAAVLWVQGAMLGAVASSIAVVAIATLGFLMLSGRIDVRRGLRTVLGCFLLFGAPAVAAAFMMMAGSQSASPPISRPVAPISHPTPLSQPDAAYDPYAGAAVPSRR